MGLYQDNPKNHNKVKSFTEKRNIGVTLYYLDGFKPNNRGFTVLAYKARVYQLLKLGCAYYANHKQIINILYMFLIFGG